MPLRWEILHDQKLVHVVAEGPVTLKEMEAHFDALVVAEALPYSKLFDATAASPLYDDDDVMAMGARLSAYTATMKSGPLAVVAADEGVHAVFKRFVNLAFEAPGPAVRHRGRGARLAGDGGRPGRRPAPGEAVRVVEADGAPAKAPGLVDPLRQRYSRASVPQSMDVSHQD
jgi:hypothetical protein